MKRNCNLAIHRAMGFADCTHQRGLAERFTVKIAGADDQVTLSVHNDGEPILADDQKSIFKSMTRGTAGASSMRSANLGLGLFITQKIVTAHGGSISVHSATGAGTTFKVVLPRY